MLYFMSNVLKAIRLKNWLDVEEIVLEPIL